MDPHAPRGGRAVAAADYADVKGDQR